MTAPQQQLLLPGLTHPRGELHQQQDSLLPPLLLLLWQGCVFGLKLLVAWLKGQHHLRELLLLLVLLLLVLLLLV